ncbi:MAG: subfamily B ATP-binding cassette protein MsbA [Roseivirga sp.]|jgi:subfamily B ATP-binding cassette protein MsbA
MKTFRRILAFAKPYHKHFPQYFIFATLAIIFSLTNLALLEPLFTIIFDYKTDDGLAVLTEAGKSAGFLGQAKAMLYEKLMEYKDANGKSGSLIFVSIIIVISALLSNLFTYLSNVTMGIVRANVVQRIRAKVFKNTTDLHLNFFSGERKGDIMSRMTNDIQEIEVTLVSSIKVLFREPATIIIYVAFLLATSFKLTLFVIVFFPIMGFLISWIVKKLKKKAVLSQESLGRIVNLMDEVFSGMRIIKGFNAKDYVDDLFEKETRTYRKINISMARKNELASPVSQFLGIVVVASLLVYGGTLVLNDQGGLDAGGLLAYIAVFSQIINPAKSISQSLSNIQRGIVSAERIFKLIDETPQIRNIENAIQLKSFDNEIEFRNVNFAYEKETVLKNINFTVKKGKTVALVGSSGGGKSTMADLIPRYFDPTGGEILIDGNSLASVNIESLRSQMGIVTQESILFNDSVIKNIAFAIPGAQLEEVMQAAKIANAHDFIMQLENGYETNIGERGGKLSGGQRQRISIARAVMKNPPILILDEATSALDSESESMVQGALTNLMKNRTSIVIAHRLSTIQHADEILVMQKGEIIERGTHQALFDQNGVYTRLISMQSI